MATVYKVQFDVDDYQYLLVDGDDAFYSRWASMMRFDGRSRISEWVPPPVYIAEPLRPVPDVFHLFGCYAPIMGPRAVASLQGYLEVTGELLPLPTARGILQLHNITLVVDCLDERTSIITAGTVRSYGFIEHRLPDKSPFKVIQTATTEFFCVDYGPGSDYDFMAVLRESGLSGLRFDAVWTSEEGPAPPQPLIRG